MEKRKSGGKFLLKFGILVIAAAGLASLTFSCDGGLGLGGGRAPEMPSFLSGVALSSSEIQLTWRDNSDNETGFKIEYGTSSSSLSHSSSASEDTEEYTVSNLESSTTYYFCICARGETKDSDSTEVVSVTTLEGIIYQETFDGGDYDDISTWYYMGGSNFTSNYSLSFSETAADGSDYSLLVTGGYMSLDVFLYTDIGSLEQPESVQIYVRPSYTDEEGGQITLMGTNHQYSTVAMVWFSNDGKFRIYSGGEEELLSYSGFTWYKLEFTNFNWTSETYDLYVNDYLEKSGASFFHTGVNGVQYVGLTNFEPGCYFRIDEILVQ
jgi:hypothetical protein